MKNKMKGEVRKSPNLERGSDGKKKKQSNDWEKEWQRELDGKEWKKYEE
jgi:hypothetical protein